MRTLFAVATLMACASCLSFDSFLCDGGSCSAGGGSTGGGSADGGSVDGGSVGGGSVGGGSVGGGSVGGGSVGGGSVGGGSIGGGSAGGGSAGGGSAGGGSAGGGVACGSGSGGGTGETSCAQTGVCASGLTCTLVEIGQSFDAVCRCGCDVVAQNCPNPGDMCTYLPSASPGGAVTRTCTTAGNLPIGAPCQLDGGACSKGTLCVQSAAGASCQKFCTNASDCPVGTACNQPIRLGNGNDEVPSVCGLNCDLAAQNCPNGGACYPLGAATNTCVLAGDVATGNNCSATQMSPQPCVKEAVCVGSAPSSSTCHRWCNLDGGAPSCVSGSCTPLVLGGGSGSFTLAAGFCP